jgi:hypothetical protein
MAHLRGLENYLGSQPFRPEMSTMERIKTWLRQGEEVLSAEAIATALPDANNKILFSLHKFMVRTECSILDELSHSPSETQLGSQIQVEKDLTALQRNVHLLHINQVRFPLS